MIVFVLETSISNSQNSQQPSLLITATGHSHFEEHN